MNNASPDSTLLRESENMRHLLVVDDDERLRQLLFRYLQENGFLVTTAEDTQQARDTLTHLEYDLVIMDVMMPGEDGVTFTRKLKSEGFNTPILLLTALGEIQDRIGGLEAGADDYLPKPFEPRELLLRINSILRRLAQSPLAAQDKPLRFGKWSLDAVRGELVAEDNTRQPLTQAEHTLLGALLERKGEAISREDLAQACNLDAAERTIDVQVTRLRKKLEEDPKTPKYIQTVRGKGYILWPD